MARSEAPKNISIVAPRFGGAPIPQELEDVARRIVEQTPGTQFAAGFKERPESSQSTRGRAAERASEWNSLLIAARADRGPQWDVGTQQFMVPRESPLYYDPSPLQAGPGDNKPDENGSQTAGTPPADPTEGGDNGSTIMMATPGAGAGQNRLYPQSDMGTPGPGRSSGRDREESSGPASERRRTRHGGGY